MVCQEVSQVKSGVNLAIEDSKNAQQVQETQRLIQRTLEAIKELSESHRLSQTPTTEAVSPTYHHHYPSASNQTNNVHSKNAGKAPSLDKVNSISSLVSDCGKGTRSTKIAAPKSFTESQNSSFAGGNLAEENQIYNDSQQYSDHDDDDVELQANLQSVG